MEINNDLNVNRVNRIFKKENKPMEQKPKDYGLQEDKFEKQDNSLKDEEDYDMIPHRDAPNYAITEDDLKGMKATSLRIVFSPEDEEKMRNMSPEERLDYQDKLLDEGKYRCVPYDS